MISTTTGRAGSVLAEMRRVMLEGVAYSRLVAAWWGADPVRLRTEVEGGDVRIHSTEPGRIAVFIETVDGVLRLLTVIAPSTADPAVSIPTDAARVGAVWLSRRSRSRTLLRLLEAGEELALVEVRPLAVPRSMLCGGPTAAPAS